MNDNEIFIVIKLVTGESLMATLLEHSEVGVHLLHPMLIKTKHYIHEGEVKESISITPWSSFTSETIYDIAEKDIVFVKELHDIYIPTYLDAVDESMRMYEISTVQELYEETNVEIDEGDRYTFAVEGNDTIN